MNPIFFTQQGDVPDEFCDVQYEPVTWWGWTLWVIAFSPVGAVTYLITTIIIKA